MNCGFNYGGHKRRSFLSISITFIFPSVRAHERQLSFFMRSTRHIKQQCSKEKMFERISFRFFLDEEIFRGKYDIDINKSKLMSEFYAITRTVIFNLITNELI